METSPKMMVVGADGCPAGWFAVTLTKNGSHDLQIFPDALSLWTAHTEAALILLDIPIGLRESGVQERLCDLQARQLLGRRGSSVFPVPCRDAVYAGTYAEACDINERLTGRRLSRQTWNITPKIRQVDQLLSSQKFARGRIREVHPEVCFWALAGGHPMRHSKKTKAGRSERTRVLRSIYPHAGDVISDALSRFRRQDVGRDDVLDALAAAVTAAAEPENLSCIPNPPESDSHGYPMEMVYRLDFLPDSHLIAS